MTLKRENITFTMLRGELLSKSEKDLPCTSLANQEYRYFPTQKSRGFFPERWYEIPSKVRWEVGKWKAMSDKKNRKLIGGAKLVCSNGTALKESIITISLLLLRFQSLLCQNMITLAANITEKLLLSLCHNSFKESGRIFSLTTRAFFSAFFHPVPAQSLRPGKWWKS